MLFDYAGLPDARVIRLGKRLREFIVWESVRGYVRRLVGLDYLLPSPVRKAEEPTNKENPG